MKEQQVKADWNMRDLTREKGAYNGTRWWAQRARKAFGEFAPSGGVAFPEAGGADEAAADTGRVFGAGPACFGPGFFAVRFICSSRVSREKPVSRLNWLSSISRSSGSTDATISAPFRA